MSKRKINEVILIKDYDYGDITDYFLTDDARACYEVMEDVDSLCYVDNEEIEDQFHSLVEELGKRKVRILIDLKEDCWVEAFLRLCKYRNIKVESIGDLVEYSY